MMEVKLIEGNAYKNTDALKINAMGMVNSIREDCEDHYVYFGSAKEMNGRIVNDVICAATDEFAD